MDRQAPRAAIDDLARNGRVTGRDERLLEVLREVSVLNLDQVRRLLWTEAKEKTAYRWLPFLLNQHLLISVRTPRSGMKTWGLLVRNVAVVSHPGLAGEPVDVTAFMDHPDLIVAGLAAAIGQYEAVE